MTLMLSSSKREIFQNNVIDRPAGNETAAGKGGRLVKSRTLVASEPAMPRHSTIRRRISLIPPAVN